MENQSFRALLIASYGRNYLARPTDPKHPSPDHLFEVSSRAKKNEGAVGDFIKVTMTSNHQVVLDEIESRKNLVFRSDAFRSKSIAANVDQILLVIATEPAFSPDLLGRASIVAAHEDIELRLLLNKCDLKDHLQRAQDMLRPYASLGIPIHEISAKQDPDSLIALEPVLAGKVSVLVGQSGMGKSTLLNRWVPNALAQTREHSTKLDTGKHTTTACRYYDLPSWGMKNNTLGALIDSPGFQEFGLAHLSESELQHAFIEFRPHLGKCRFNNCTHQHEPDCAINDAVVKGEIHPERLKLFSQLIHETRNATIQSQGHKT
ncbi:MAG: ribosome small subunit-dependent GTPase A [Betaproteobacteria bacterium]